MGQSKRRKQAMGSAYGKPRPVPFSERSPKPSDCDELGWCWAWNDWSCNWEWIHHEHIADEADAYTHWLPINAIPNPRDTEPNRQAHGGSHQPETSAMSTPTPAAIEAMFREWWAQSYPTPPCTHAINTHVAFAEWLLIQSQRLPSP